MATDLRASASLVLAGLAAARRDRGRRASTTSTAATSGMEVKLRALGAAIDRVK